MDDYDHPSWGNWFPNDDYFETPDGTLDGTASLEEYAKPSRSLLANRGSHGRKQRQSKASSPHICGSSNL